MRALLLFVAISTFLLGSCNRESSRDFDDLVFHSCYDGDTCTFTIRGVHPLLGEKIGVRLAGIDTPEIKGKCGREKDLARKAKAFLNAMLKKARRIRLLNPRRGKYFRIVADIEADGIIVNEKMLREGLAHRYDGGKRKSWC